MQLPSQAIASRCTGQVGAGDLFNYCVNAKPGARCRHECPIALRRSQVVCGTKLRSETGALRASELPDRAGQPLGEPPTARVGPFGASATRFAFSGPPACLNGRRALRLRRGRIKLRGYQASRMGGREGFSPTLNRESSVPPMIGAANPLRSSANRMQRVAIGLSAGTPITYRTMMRLSATPSNQRSNP